MEVIKFDQDLANVGLRAAYQAQPDPGVFYHMKVAATFISFAAGISARYRRAAAEFADLAKDLYGQMLGQVEADIARGHDPRKDVPGIPVAGEREEFVLNLRPDPDIWARMVEALGKRGPMRSAEEA